MNSGARLLTLALIPALLIFLSACTSSSVRTADGTGVLGKTRAASAADIYVKLAVAYMQDGQIDMALKKVKRGLEIDPGNAGAHNVIALLYERLGEAVAAEEHYRKALRLDSQDPYVHNAYGSFLCTQKRFKDADQQFVQALTNPLYKTPEVALSNAGICAEREGNPKQAEGYFRRALQANGRFPTALIRMAFISYNKGQYLPARGYLQRYLEVAGHTAETLWLGIRTERELGDLDTVASYELLLQAKFPDSEEMRLLQELKQQ